RPLVYLPYKSPSTHCDLHSFTTRRSSDLPSIAARVLSNCSVIRSTSVRILARLRILTFLAIVFWRLIPQLASGLSSGSDMLVVRSEEHTSELQSRVDLVCRLLLEKKNHKI